MINKGATVLLAAHSQYRGVYMGVAQRLKAELGAQVHLYTATPQESAYYERTFPDLFSSITVADVLYTACRELLADEEAVFEEARQNEANFDVTINELAVGDRHLGRGFSLGGFKHPRSRISEKTSYVQMLNGFNAVIDFWRRELDEKRPDLVLNASKVLCVLARKRDIPVRILMGSRYKNYHYWAVNEFFENARFETAYRTAKPSANLGLEAPYDAHLRFRAHFRKEASLWRTMKATGYQVLRQIYWTMRGYEKTKGYYLWENVAYLWRRYRDINHMTRQGLAGLDGFKERSFAFFPLATEPESALQRLSPEYLYQLSAIASVARDLPAGAELAVKEHYAAAGRRPADFFKQIVEFKNVRMMNMSELGMDVARASRAVVTISGTSGFEGAVLGLPVICFGRHNIYNFLPHVMVVTDETQLREYLARAFSDDFDAERASTNGIRFLQAVIEVSFDLADFAPIEPDKVSDTALAGSYRALLGGLDAEAPPPPRPVDTGQLLAK
jgi:hypothetical protein